MILEDILADPAWFPALLTVAIFWVIVLFVALLDPGGFGN